VVKTTGDGLLAEFASVVDAVGCAVAFQEGMQERNNDTPEDHRIEFRIWSIRTRGGTTWWNR
jgi:class 3 adenylate cyclase